MVETRTFRLAPVCHRSERVEKIIRDQHKEIAQFDTWLQAHK